MRKVKHSDGRDGIGCWGFILGLRKWHFQPRPEGHRIWGVSMSGRRAAERSLEVGMSSRKGHEGVLKKEKVR